MRKSLVQPIMVSDCGEMPKKSNSNRIQAFRSITLRKLTNSTPRVSNYTLNTDLKIEKTVKEEAIAYYKRFRIRLASRSNPPNKSSFSKCNPSRHLKRE